MSLLIRKPSFFQGKDIAKMKLLTLEKKMLIFYSLRKYPDTTWFYHKVIGVGSESELSSKERIVFYKHLCEYDLYYFCKYILKKDKICEQPNRDMAEKIMIRKRPNDQERKLICEPRGTYKTTIGSIGYPIWRIVKDPNISIQLDSETDNQAKDIYLACKDELENNFLLISIWGEHKSNRWNDAKLYSKKRTRIRRDPTLFHTGIETSINGLHPDVAIVDDPHSELNVQNVDQRDKVDAHYKTLTPLVDKVGEIIIIMTRWALDDLAGRLIKRENDVFSVISVRSCYKKNGQLYAPKILTRKFLDGAKKTMGMYQFSANYLNDPKPDTDKSFKREWLNYWDREAGAYPQTINDNGDLSNLPLNIYLSIDASWADKSSNTGRDPTAIIVAGITASGDIYVLDIFNKRIPPDIVIEKIFELKRNYKALAVATEDLGTQKGLNKLLEDEMETRNDFFVLDRVKHQATSKGARIASLQPLFCNGKIFVPNDIGNDFIEQYENFSPGSNIAHDDILDALEMLVRQYREVYSNQDEEDEKWEDEHFDVYCPITGRLGVR